MTSMAAIITNNKWLDWGKKHYDNLITNFHCHNAIVSALLAVAHRQCLVLNSCHISSSDLTTIQHFNKINGRRPTVNVMLTEKHNLNSNKVKASTLSRSGFPKFYGVIWNDQIRHERVQSFRLSVQIAFCLTT